MRKHNTTKMLSYLFLQETFKAVLEKSSTIQGRFHFCPKFGAEINSDQLGEVIAELFQGNQPVTRYPMALAMPPRSTGGYNKTDAWDEYSFSIFFLKQSFVDSQNKVQWPNTTTRTSMHSVEMDWHDMKRAAVGFMRALDILQRKQTDSTRSWRTKGQSYTSPVSYIGTDRAAGIRLDFTIQLFIGCELVDYTTNDIKLITLPAADSHPEHIM